MAQMQSGPPQKPTYDRTWEEIDEMLHLAIHERNSWVTRFERAQSKHDKLVMKDAARNCKALEGVIKTLKWTIGTPNVEDPLS